MKKTVALFLILGVLTFCTCINKAKAFAGYGKDSVRSPIRFGVSIGPQWLTSKPYFFKDQKTMFAFVHSVTVEKQFHPKFAAQVGFRYTSISNNNKLNREDSGAHYTPLRTYCLDYALKLNILQDKDGTKLYATVGSSLQWVPPVFVLQKNQSEGPEFSFSRSLITFGSVGVDVPISDRVDVRLDVRAFRGKVTCITEDFKAKTTRFNEDIWGGGQFSIQFFFQP